MWNKWVGRTKTQNDALVEVVEPAGRRSRSVSPSRMTPEEREEWMRVKQDRQDLKVLFRRCLDPSEGEQERTVLFGSNILPKFALLYADRPYLRQKEITESFDDLRSFTITVTKHFMNEIRQIPDSQNKAEASKEIMRILRSKEHLFYSLKAIKALCYGPDFVLQLLIQPKIPSMIIKLFRSFIDLPESEYISSNVFPLQNSAGTPITESSNDQKSMSELNGTVQDVEVVITDVLRQFVKRHLILHKLIIEDAFFMLVKMAIASPTTDDFESPSPQGSLNSYQIRWKERIIDVLTSMDVDGEVVSYLHSKNYMITLVQCWKDFLERNNGRGVITLDYPEVVLHARLCFHLLQSSARDALYPLFNDFKEAEGYETLAKIIVYSPFNDETNEAKTTLFSILENMVFVGKDEPRLNTVESIPYQHSDFQFPPISGPADSIIRNNDAFQCMLAIFLFPEGTIYPSITSSSLSLPPPVSFRLPILQTIETVIRKNPINYFLIEKFNPLPLLIEKLDLYPMELRDIIMKLLVYVMTDLNYVPFRELAVVSLHFQGTTSAATTALVCKTITFLLRKSPKFKNVFREVGALNVLISLLQNLAETLQETLGNAQFVRRLSVSSMSKAKLEKQATADQTLKNYDVITDCVIEMISGCRENAVAFGRGYKGSLFDFMHYDETRYGALRLFEALVIESNSSHSRNASSPSSSSPTSFKELEHSFQFGRLIEIIQSLPRQDFTMKIHILQSMRQIFIRCPEMKDVFRNTGGYVCLVSMLVNLEGVYDELEDRKQENETAIIPKRLAQLKKENVRKEVSVESKDQTIKLLKAVFIVLAESMSGHDYNRRFFSDHIGFQSVEDAIRLSDVMGPKGSAESMFGILFAFLIDNEVAYDLFLKSTEDDSSLIESPQTPVEDKKRSQLLDVEERPKLQIPRSLSRIEHALRDPMVFIHNPDVVPTLLRLQRDVNNNEELSLAIYFAIQILSWGNRRNQIALNRSGVLFEVLERLYPKSLNDSSRPLSSLEIETLNRIARRSMGMGVSSQELRFLFESFQSGSPDLVSLDTHNPKNLLDLILFGIMHSRWPNFIQFDMSRQGYSALTIPTLGQRSFPPQTAGYTFLAWFQIERLDPSVNLILLGLSDEDRRCFLNIYIDAQSRKLTVQTSPRNSVRFDAFEFLPGFWYHIALVHYKSRMSASSSTLILYVNGTLTEQVRCSYLSQPYPNARVHGFLGTPKELGQREYGQKNPGLVWDLGPCYLMENTVDADVINLLFNLSARYKSLFQDSLRQFQTYETSTALYLNLRAIKKTSDTTQDMDHAAFVQAMRGGGGASLPEERILFAFFASNSLGEGQVTGMTTTGLSEAAMHILSQIAVHGRMVVNAAVPKLEIALTAPAGMGTLVGNPIVAFPYGLDDSMWKIGGIAVALKLVERAETPESLQKTVAILFELIRFSWRNSEDMERLHGYEILAYILKQKRTLITLGLLNALLIFVGMNAQNPEESVINNPFAYRYVIMNFEIWKRASVEVQRAHLEQFVIFIQRSRKKSFNIRRLLRLHLVRKMLLALRMNVYPTELIPSFLAALKVVVLSNWTVETIRAIATFLVSSSTKSSSTRTKERPRSIIRQRSLSPTSRPLEPRLPEKVTRQRSLSPASRIDEVKESSQTPSKLAVVIGNAKSLQTDATPKNVRMCNLVMEMLHDILCEKTHGQLVTKFAVTITNKWPLLFFSEDTHPYCVILAARILARLFQTQGNAYVAKFRFSSDGFLIMRRLLPRFWYISQLYQTLYAMMLGVDICDVPLESNFDLYTLVTLFKKNEQRLGYHDVMPIVLALMKEGIDTIVRHHPSTSDKKGHESHEKSRSLTASLGAPLEEKNGQGDDMDFEIEMVKQRLSKIGHLVQTSIHFFSDMYNFSYEFKEICLKPEVIDGICEILFPIVCSADPISIEAELNARDNNQTFDSDLSLESAGSPVTSGSVLSTNYSEEPDNIDENDNHAESPRVDSPLKRGGSFILITKTSHYATKKSSPSLIRPSRSESGTPVRSRTPSFDNSSAKTATVESLVEFLVEICVSTVVDPQNKNLAGLEAALKSFPPSLQEHQIQFEGYLLTHVIASLRSHLQLNSGVMNDSRVVVNLVRFSQIVIDAVFQGWFLNGNDINFEFLAMILEMLQSFENIGMKRIPDQTLSSIYRCFNRTVLLRFSELEQPQSTNEDIIAFLNKCIYYQKVILAVNNTDIEFLKCVCYHLYKFLLEKENSLNVTAMNFWKLVMLQKPIEISMILKTRVKGLENRDLVEGFSKLVEMDPGTFILWMDSRKAELALLFQETISKVWEAVIAQENKNTREGLKANQNKRHSKLKRLLKKYTAENEVISEYTSKTIAWVQSIQYMENNRFAKVLQDNDSHDNFVRAEWSKASADLFRERALWGRLSTQSGNKWKMDLTEGRCRMRKKMQPNLLAYSHISLHTTKQTNQTEQLELPKTPGTPGTPGSIGLIDDAADVQDPLKAENWEQSNLRLPNDKEDDAISISNSDPGEANVETVDDKKQDDPEDDMTYEEDKNRMVLRLLDPGDMVLEVYNVSRVTGLDACEGLLLLCKSNIYLIDNFFQRPDGEVVEIWDVPKSERDQYLQLLEANAGYETQISVNFSGDKHECRKWSLEDIREAHKRRFLFRDVALELFFADGRNTLITLDIKERDVVHSKLANNISSTLNAKESVLGTSTGIQLEGVPAALLNTATFPFKITNFFGASTLTELTERWQRREISNFQYLMHLNTIAGRSYNDLTQYPVFPWILADYSSEELDLENPKTFRNLSKPMGAQTPERSAEFADRYRQWGETTEDTPAFHYGTHYSSAMIVCSFLIRLEPFTQHYLKLQGGTFDHADRLFDSVGKAWASASEKNMSDVRELIPEFFYLPEFLENANKFNFGTKQGSGEVIDSVVLPPWAHGDPKIFIHRHREALECEFVSNNIHTWIDLIFGYKQQGPAAIEELNVFHHLSYEGAVDLDAIQDPIEKTATIGIIHNFGQTPRQLFKKPHPRRLPAQVEPAQIGYYKFYGHVEKLIESAAPMRDIRRQVGSISMHNDRLSVCANQQVLIPPDGLRFIEWGFADNSLRLFATETGRVLNVYESMHVEAISSACFADNRTLITGGTDSVVCAWRLQQRKGIEFTLLECLRGHHAKVNCIATSRSYSIIVTGSEDKTCIIWDLNRLRYVRQLPGHELGVQAVAINDTTGDIATCSGSVLRLWTINGELLFNKTTSHNPDPIMSCLFYEGENNEWFNHELIFTGHKKGIIKIWSRAIANTEQRGNNKWRLDLRHQLQHHDRFQTNAPNPDIMALYISNSQRILYSGDTYGRVFAWILPDGCGNGHFIKEDRVKDCLSCAKPFSVLERKFHCRSCGGIFCNACTEPSPLYVPDKGARVCAFCATKLRQHQKEKQVGMV